jgi:sterol desaturase/sphingolipid hydroxylase (fatty acid hydroxylase superfamily)
MECILYFKFCAKCFKTIRTKGNMVKDKFTIRDFFFMDKFAMPFLISFLWWLTLLVVAYWEYNMFSTGWEFVGVPYGITWAQFVMMAALPLFALIFMRLIFELYMLWYKIYQNNKKI